MQEHGVDFLLQNGRIWRRDGGMEGRAESMFVPTAVCRQASLDQSVLMRQSNLLNYRVGETSEIRHEMVATVVRVDARRLAFEHVGGGHGSG
jgi:hypothetical protein